MEMRYSLNGKEIDRSRFLLLFQGMADWIEGQAREAAGKGEAAPMFRTGLGTLIITIEDPPAPGRKAE